MSLVYKKIHHHIEGETRGTKMSRTPQIAILVLVYDGLCYFYFLHADLILARL